MAQQSDCDIVLYDLACTKGLCFSPVVWRIRLMLNYKKIPYRTVFLGFPDIEPTLKDLGLKPFTGTKYTVPAIHHVPTNTYMIDSVPIAQFLETTYPDPPLTLTSELGREIETLGRSALGPAVRVSITPREINILSPRDQEFFRRTREAALGHPLEDLLTGDKEEQMWTKTAPDTRALGQLLMKNKADGPFILGETPSMTDFFIIGNLQCARMIDEGVFNRYLEMPGFKELYDACLPWMDKKD